MAEQASILDAASAFVKPGGLLAYITCSVFEPENGGQITAFRERVPSFQSVDHRALWEKHFPGHSGSAHIDEDRGITLSPARSGTDGFFFSALRKTS